MGPLLLVCPCRRFPQGYSTVATCQPGSFVVRWLNYERTALRQAQGQQVLLQLKNPAGSLAPAAMRNTEPSDERDKRYKPGVPQQPRVLEFKEFHWPNQAGSSSADTARARPRKVLCVPSSPASQRRRTGRQGGTWTCIPRGGALPRRWWCRRRGRGRPGCLLAG